MLYFFLCLAFYSSVPVISGLYFRQSEIKWSSIDYQWENETDQLIKSVFSGWKEQEDVIIDAEGSKDGRIFLTVLRKKHSPASLTVIENKDIYNTTPNLKPYPDWTWAEEDNCNGIISAYRFAIDNCNRLWVLDTGVVENEQICPSKLLTFDLETDKLLKKVEIPDHLTYKNVFGQPRPLITPIVETEGIKCERTHVYMADESGQNLVVYNGSSIWNVNPNNSLVYASSRNISLSEGLAGFALGPLIDLTDRSIFYRPLGKKNMVEAQIWHLRRHSQKFPMINNEFSSYLVSQSTAMAFTPNGTLLFGLSNSLAIGCWHISKPLNDQNIELLNLDMKPGLVITGLKIVPSTTTKSNNEIWITGHEHISEKNPLKVENFVYPGRNIDALIAGTKCDPQPKFKHPFDATYEFLKKKYIHV